MSIFGAYGASELELPLELTTHLPKRTYITRVEHLLLGWLGHEFQHR